MEYIIDDTLIQEGIKREVSRLAANAVDKDGNLLYDGIAITSRDKETLQLMVDNAVSTFVMSMARYVTPLLWYRWQGDNNRQYFTTSPNPALGSKVLNADGTLSGGELYIVQPPKADPIYHLSIGDADIVLTYTGAGPERPFDLYRDGFGLYLPDLDKSTEAMAKPVIDDYIIMSVVAYWCAEKYEAKVQEYADKSTALLVKAKNLLLTRRTITSEL